jgi:hypothetical protein
MHEKLAPRVSRVHVRRMAEQSHTAPGIEADWLNSLERSEAQLAEGQARSGFPARQRLRDSIARMRGQMKEETGHANARTFPI